MPQQEDGGDRGRNQSPGRESRRNRPIPATEREQCGKTTTTTKKNCGSIARDLTFMSPESLKRRKPAGWRRHSKNKHQANDSNDGGNFSILARKINPKIPEAEHLRQDKPKSHPRHTIVKL